MKIKTLRGLILTAEVVISDGTCAAACDESSPTDEFKAQIDKKLRENIGSKKSTKLSWRLKCQRYSKPNV